MKCQKCSKQATTHITEVLGEEQFEELNLCDDCAQKYLYEPPKKAPKIPEFGDEEAADAAKQECQVCGLKFVEFRNSGRLGCAHDYTAFRAELLPLLENIHGDTRHTGKTPRRLPQLKKTQSQLTELRKQLQQAVTREAYEDAARLRDSIRRLEGG